MKSAFYIVLLLSLFSFCSCNRAEKTDIQVQDVTLEEVDSSEMIAPPPLSSKNKQCDCDVIIDDNYKQHVSVYEKPNGNEIKKLKHLEKDEDYLVAKLEQDSDDFFYAKVGYAISGSYSYGWIKKTAYIGVYGRNYDTSLNLYSLPHISSKITATISWDHQLYKVSKCSGKWLYVSLTSAGTIKSGWLSPEMQCANHYTTCN